MSRTNTYPDAEILAFLDRLDSLPRSARGDEKRRQAEVWGISSKTVHGYISKWRRQFNRPGPTTKARAAGTLKSSKSVKLVPYSEQALTRLAMARGSSYLRKVSERIDVVLAKTKAHDEIRARYEAEKAQMEAKMQAELEAALMGTGTPAADVDPTPDAGQPEWTEEQVQEAREAWRPLAYPNA